MHHWRTFRAASLCGAALLLSACVPPVTQPTQTTCSNPTRSVDGYWFVTETSEGRKLETGSVIEYWYLRSVGADAKGVAFEITDACNLDDVLARGRLTPEGGMQLLDEAGDFARSFADFVDDNVFEGSPNGERRIQARRISAPPCTATSAVGQPAVKRHKIEFIVEDDESLLADASKVGAQQAKSHNGLMHLDEARGDGLPIGDDTSHANGDATMMCQDADGNSVPCPDAPNDGHAGYVECSVQNWTDSRVQELAEVVALNESAEVYPGALVQGASFAGGSFAPITIPRSGGRVTLSGLTLTGPAVCREFKTPYTPASMKCRFPK